MQSQDLYFVIPTYRLRDVGETVEQYDEHLWRNGHSVPMVVFDDSSPANHEKYYAVLEATRTHNDLFYVGPKEKERFLAFLDGRLRDRKLQSLVKNLFRPSYGGNRNYPLMYTLVALFVSNDDDMRPFAFMETSPEYLADDEVCHGRLRKTGQNGYTKKSFDILTSFLDVLGKKVAEVPENYERGDLLVDTATDLETNATKGLARENSLMLRRGGGAPDAGGEKAPKVRSGPNHVDAGDFVDMFLDDESSANLDAVNDVYVLENFRPVVTNLNWRMDCGVAGYDNTAGLPPFFPTRLRFEDYIYRLWIQQDGIVAAHVDAAQNHSKSTYMRNPPASEILNEEIANLLKRKIKSTITRLDDLTIAFDYDGEVLAQDAEEILTKIRALHAKATEAARASPPERSVTLRLFAENLDKTFYGFESDFFQQNLQYVVNDVVSVVKGTMEIWPTLVEICYFEKSRRGLPQIRVENQARGERAPEPQ